MTYFKTQLCPDCRHEQERRQRRPHPPPTSTQNRNPDNFQPSPLQRRNAMRIPDNQRPQPTQRQPPSSTDVEDPRTWRPDSQGRDRRNPQSQRPNRYMDRPLPPLPLQPHRQGSAPQSSPYGPSGAQGQRPRAQSQSRGSRGQPQQQGPQRRGSMSQGDRPPSTGYRPASIQHPRPRPGALPRVVTHDWDDWSVPSPQSTPPTPPQQPQMPQRRASASIRRPTPSSISRMDEQINSAEQMWSNAGPSSSSRRPSVSGPSGSGSSSSRGFVNPVPPVPQAYPTSSLTDPRNYRSQREGRYA